MSDIAAFEPQSVVDDTYCPYQGAKPDIDSRLPSGVPVFCDMISRPTSSPLGIRVAPKGLWIPAQLPVWELITACQGCDDRLDRLIAALLVFLFAAPDGPTVVYMGAVLWSQCPPNPGHLTSSSFGRFAAAKTMSAEWFRETLICSRLVDA